MAFLGLKKLKPSKHGWDLKPVKAPQQQGGWQCGYCTMQNMTTLATAICTFEDLNIQNDFFAQCTESKEFYDETDVRKVREFWSEGYLKHDLTKLYFSDDDDEE